MPRIENTGMDGGPCGKGAVLLRLLGRKSLASSTLAPSASRSAVIGHGIGPGIQSAKTGWIGMAERSRAYVSDAFAHIPPWCNGSTRVFGTFGPGSNPGGGAWRQHVELIFPSTLDSMFVVPDIQGQASTQAAKTTPRPCSSVDRASASGAEGHESDSR